MFKLYLVIGTLFSVIQLCPAPCNFDDCDALADDKNIGRYDNFCTEAGLFTPYLKTYRKRRGKLIPYLSGGPKMYDVHKEEDIYVCVNGPVWLYKAKHTPLGVVFHKPEYKTAVHECQFFNGKKNPGNTQDEEDLMGILLMGAKTDYRQPAMQLFTAPLYNNVTKYYENVTSIMTFGKKACRVQRGSNENNVILTIQPNPSDDNSYCQLAYQNIDNIFPSRTAASKAKDDSSLLQKFLPFADIVRQLLKNDMPLKQLGCEKVKVAPATPTLTSPLDIPGMIEKYKERAAADKAEYEKKINDINFPLESVIANLTIDKHTDLVTDLENIPDLIKAEKEKLADPATKEAAAIEIKRLESEKILKEYQLYAIEICNSSFPKDDPKKDFESVWGNIPIYLSETVSSGGGTTLFWDAQINVTAAYQNWTSIAKNDSLGTLNATMKKLLREFEKIYTEKLKVLNIELANVERLFVTAHTISQRQLERIQNCKNVVDNWNKGRLLIPKTSQMESTFISIEQTSKQTNSENCFKLPTLEEECKKAKPVKNRVCHFLKSVVHDPAICVQDEEKNMTAIPPDVTTELYIGANNTEILDLIKEIFEVACELFPDKSFADKITRIFKCYLMKPIQFEGAGMSEITNPENIEKHKAIGNHMEAQILQALRKCKDEKKIMIFQKDPNSGPGKNQKKFKYWHDGVLTDVLLHQEQADKEFAFNFAIDMHFKMFATVMGLCMASEDYKNRNSLLSSMFYATYSRIFYHPLRFAWTNPRDNRIFNLILGNFKNQNGDLFANHCMEASFIHGKDTDYRPPRYLVVNSNTEPNFFTSGRLANKEHIYLNAFK